MPEEEPEFAETGSKQSAIAEHATLKDLLQAKLVQARKDAQQALQEMPGDWEPDAAKPPLHAIAPGLRLPDQLSVRPFARSAAGQEQQHGNANHGYATD